MKSFKFYQSSCYIWLSKFNANILTSQYFFYYCPIQNKHIEVILMSAYILHAFQSKMASCWCKFKCNSHVPSTRYLCCARRDVLFARRKEGGSGAGVGTTVSHVAMCSHVERQSERGAEEAAGLHNEQCPVLGAHGLHAAYLLIVTARSTNDILFGFY